MKKLILLLCISVMLAGCGKENTESSSALETIDVVEDITFNVKGKEVEVIKGEEIIQILDCNYTSDKEKIFTEDYDFDGFDDLFVMMENGAMYAPGTYFRYNPDTEMYEKWDTLNKIGRQVIIDDEKQTLKYRKNTSEYWMEYLIYKWDNDRLILSEHIASEDGKNFKNLPLTEETVENTTADVNITLDEATEKLWSLIDTGEENQHLAYEEIRDYGERQCYLFREYNDFDTHRATTGWYAVDVKTGECFDALNELIPLETKETEPANVYEKQSYKQLLKNIYYEMKFPDYDYNEENYLSSYSMEENEFAIYDIDNDGSDELILMFTSSAMAGMVGYIYDHDGEGRIIEEYRGFPSLRFYDNGIIEEKISHNQGNSGEFWPYTLYKYDTQTDIYEEIAHVSAIDRELIEYKNQMAEESGVENVWEYPHDIDVSNSGFVYNILKSEDRKTKPDDYVYVDVTEYEKWHNSYIGNAELIELPFIKLTEENIEKVTQ
ncbi:MAG: hypothetical protein E7508_00540 [Ruminococcus sp.]|nr:hypothetical protein [Ruminococcus sp.]